MRKSEIAVGNTYIAKVSGKLTTVRVDEAKSGEGFKMPGTGRRLKLDDEAPNPYITDYPAMPGDPSEGPPVAGEDEPVPSEMHPAGSRITPDAMPLG